MMKNINYFNNVKSLNNIYKDTSEEVKCLQQYLAISEFPNLEYLNVELSCFIKWATMKTNGNTLTVRAYPDTLVWIRDFSYSYNEPMTQRYFSHPAYGNYPVVGVTWKQADAFCNWRTRYLNSYLDSKKRAQESDFRLPTEAQWEYAARGA